MLHEGLRIQALLGSAQRCLTKPWLRPLRPALTPAGTPLLRMLQGDMSVINSLAVGADGSRVVCSDEDLVLHVWDLTTGARVRSFSLENHEWVSCMTTIPGTNWILLGTDRGRL